MAETNGELPIDDAHTNRSHVGEGIADGRNYPGYLLIGLALATLGLTLVALGYGFQGWALIGGAVCAVSLVLGVVVILLERRRIKHLEGNDLMDQEGH